MCHPFVTALQIAFQSRCISTFVRDPTVTRATELTLQRVRKADPSWAEAGILGVFAEKPSVVPVRVIVMHHELSGIYFSVRLTDYKGSTVSRMNYSGSSS